MAVRRRRARGAYLTRRRFGSAAWPRGVAERPPDAAEWRPDVAERPLSAAG